MPRFVILGRPNVGKSTLFNRLLGRKHALVDPQPGATRDWREADINLAGLTFTLIDTAGLETTDGSTLSGRMTQKSLDVLEKADGLFFVVDARAGLLPDDFHYAALARRSGKPCLLLANKCEGQRQLYEALEAYSLGLGDPIAISAEHGEGLADLIPALEGLIRQITAEKGDEDDEGEKPYRIAIVGRPNVGKSTLINSLIGEDRMLTGPEAGITRDAIAVDFCWRNQPVSLYDTAGLRRRARVVTSIEKLSGHDTRRAVNFAETVILLIDITTPFDKQDLQLADYIHSEGRALIIGLNKWDLIEESEKKAKLKELSDDFHYAFPRLSGAPIVALSGKESQGLGALMRTAFALREPFARHIATARLNRWLAEAISAHPPPRRGAIQIKFSYATQPKTKPPTVALFCNKASDVPDSYLRYLENSLKDTFALNRVPVRLIIRQKGNPYAPASPKTRKKSASRARK